MGGRAKPELRIQVRMSSSAKADDPVRRAVRVLSYAGDYWIPAGACHRARQRRDPLAGMTTVLGAFRAAKYAVRTVRFAPCAFTRRVECWSAAKGYEGFTMTGAERPRKMAAS